MKSDIRFFIPDLRKVYIYIYTPLLPHSSGRAIYKLTNLHVSLLVDTFVVAWKATHSYTDISSLVENVAERKRGAITRT